MMMVVITTDDSPTLFQALCQIVYVYCLFKLDIAPRKWVFLSTFYVGGSESLKAKCCAQGRAGIKCGDRWGGGGEGGQDLSPALPDPKVRALSLSHCTGLPLKFSGMLTARAHICYF